MARKEREYICHYCDKKFLSRKKDAKYCSKECQYKGMKKETFIIKCQYCGKEFKTSNINRKFCSMKCNNKSIARNKLNNPKKLNTKCSNCGKSFYLPKCRLPQNNEYRYCSRKCKHEHKMVITIKQYMEIYKIPDMKLYLYQRYIVEKKNYREIENELNMNESRTLNKWLRYYKIPIRHGSEAVLTQYFGEKGLKRKQNFSGENSPFWNPNLTDEERLKNRKTLKYNIWHSKVLKRDKYTCRVTGIKGNGDLIVHHLNSYDNDKQGRCNVDNGVTILECVHKIFHKYYGYGNNTKEQFKEFVKKFDNHEFDRDLKIIC